jgi:hypothetical protein
MCTVIVSSQLRSGPSNNILPLGFQNKFCMQFSSGPTQPPIQWVPGALSLGVKRPGSEADYSPPSSAEVKE